MECVFRIQMQTQAGAPKTKKCLFGGHKGQQNALLMEEKNSYHKKAQETEVIRG